MSGSTKIFITDTHARVPNGLGGFKTITLKDLGKELLRVAEDEGESSIGQSIRFPNEMIAMNFTDRKIDMMLYFPKRKVDLKFSPHERTLSYPGCAFPAIIITIGMDKRLDKWSMSAVCWFATDMNSSEIPAMGAGLPKVGSFKGRVFAVPFPNQYGNGTMCVGHNAYRTSYDDNWVAMNELYWHILVGSPFNNDIKADLKTFGQEDYFEFLQTQDEFPYGIIKGHPGEDTFAKYMENKDDSNIPF